MRYIFTLFDYKHYPVRPWQSLVLDGSAKFYTFFLPNSGLKIKQIVENIAEARSIFETDVGTNDFKAHLAAFDLPKTLGYMAYDLCLPKLSYKPSDEQTGRKILTKIAKEAVGLELMPWQRLMSEAAVVYQVLEDIGVRNSYRREHPHYSLDTYTGRSSASYFNIQGTTDLDDIRPTTDDFDFFVQFDWIAADIRMAAHMSQDEMMIDAFKKSDPYSKIAEFLNDPEHPRDKCKSEFLKALYSLRVDDPVFMTYPQFRQWMKERLRFMNEHKWLDTILGRHFHLTKENQLSVFNAQFQGSVAHSMHAAMIKIFDKYPHNLLTEVHDSIIMFGKERVVNNIIKDVVPIMLEPLLGYVKNPPIMPVRVSVAKKWRQWHPVKVYRSKQM